MRSFVKTTFIYCQLLGQDGVISPEICSEGKKPPQNSCLLLQVFWNCQEVTF